jgi:hypothetical protein
MGGDDKMDLEKRKSLTFAQAEGQEALPSQLKLGQLSDALRARLWAVVFEELVNSNEDDLWIGNPWRTALRSLFVEHWHKPADEFPTKLDWWVKRLKPTFLTGTYVDVLGLVQIFLRHPNTSTTIFSQAIDEALSSSMAAYRVADWDTIVPYASEAEGKTLEQAFADLAVTEYNGARAHLRKAAEELTAGRFADSVRESIHAVEAVVRTIEPDNDFGRALAKLEAQGRTHRALKKSFTALYGYTSDERGIRHSLLDAGDANVDETAALFMLGACAAFVSYLIHQAA